MVPDSSKVPCLHCLVHQELAVHDIILISPMVELKPNQLQVLREALLGYLTVVLGNDGLAVEFVLLHLLSKVHAKVDALVKLSLNLTVEGPLMKSEWRRAPSFNGDGDELWTSVDSFDPAGLFVSKPLLMQQECEDRNAVFIDPASILRLHIEQGYLTVLHEDGVTSTVHRPDRLAKQFGGPAVCLSTLPDIFKGDYTVRNITKKTTTFHGASSYFVPRRDSPSPVAPPPLVTPCPDITKGITTRGQALKKLAPQQPRAKKRNLRKAFKKYNASSSHDLARAIKKEKDLSPRASRPGATKARTTRLLLDKSDSEGVTTKQVEISSVAEEKGFSVDVTAVGGPTAGGTTVGDPTVGAPTADDATTTIHAASRGDVEFEEAGTVMGESSSSEGSLLKPAAKKRTISAKTMVSIDTIAGNASSSAVNICLDDNELANSFLEEDNEEGEFL
ncbi:hypothetical protein Vadar_010816 [Vaccinium darrowii]|uniref:Uncharacterized protein n=1 Tax=Vaccinium darrowii TaxID=229202 RepID=A0ACB7WZY2_9ERIC|nr:hypothetical protein Vadar_010816 [Vaccinium darrowii]